MTGSRQPTRVWDLPTRLFHWVLAGCAVGSVVTAKIGGNAMEWHLRLGYIVFTLLAFRLVWGLVGGRWSRFASFLYSPGALMRYVRGQSRHEEHHEVGHSPLGALSVFGLLGMLALQVATGLVADDEIATTGPLIQFVSGRTSLVATAWHKGWGQGLVIGLALLHLAAVVYYAMRRGRDLVRPMISGDKALPPGVPAAADHAVARALAAAALTLCAAGVAWVVSLGG
ncbi:MAG TPA: cytochrome b/b6 domain-containing protein [Albitalea sp.]